MVSTSAASITEVVQAAVHSATIPAQSQSKRPISSRAWLVLLVASLNSAFNAFICMNFSPVSQLTGDVLSASESDVAWLYSGFLLAVCCGMPPALLVVVKFEGIALGLSCGLNALCAWLRWFGVQRRSYSLCLASAFLSGAGAALFLPLPAQISQQRFPAERWSFTTSLMIQANYTGWMLGCLLVPLLVEDAADMETFLLAQAILSLGIMASFFAMYKEAPAQDAVQGMASRLAISGSLADVVAERAPGEDFQGVADIQQPLEARVVVAPAAHGSGGSLKDTLQTIKTYPTFTLQVLAYGLLGGVGFAVPGCNDTILEHRGVAAKTTAFLDLAFIGTGVVCGLILGSRCNNPLRYGKVLLSLFVVAAVSLTGLTVFLEVFVDRKAGDSEKLVVLVLLASTGAASVGFLGLGIEAASYYPAGGTYACFLIELIIQLSGAVLNELGSKANGFIYMAGAAWLAFFLLLAGQRRPTS